MISIASSLTAKQLAVLIGIASDKPMKQIAADLGCSIKTVQYHWAQVKRHTGLQSYVGATLWAIRNGLVSV